MEAFALCKRRGKYWMIASGCTGWEPNAARSATADHPFGEWRELGNPCVGEGAETMFGGQSAFIFPPRGKSTAAVAMFDIWRPENLPTSGYMWLPIQWIEERMIIRREDERDGNI